MSSENTEERIRTLERLAISQHEMLGLMSDALRGHQKIIEALSAIAGVDCPTSELPMLPATTLH